MRFVGGPFRLYQAEALISYPQGSWVSTKDAGSVDFQVEEVDSRPHLYPWELGVFDR